MALASLTGSICGKVGVLVRAGRWLHWTSRVYGFRRPFESRYLVRPRRLGNVMLSYKR
jgi:hypothetical protein